MKTLLGTKICMLYWRNHVRSGYAIHCKTKKKKNKKKEKKNENEKKKKEEEKNTDEKKKKRIKSGEVMKSKREYG